MRIILLSSLFLLTSTFTFAMENTAINQLFQLVKEREVNVEAVQQLLAQHPTLVNRKDERGFALIHYACRGKSTAIVEALLKAGADVASVNRWNNTALCEAAVNGEAEVVRILLLQKSDPNFANGKALQLAKQSRCGEHHMIKDTLEQLTKKEFGGLLPNL